MTVRDNLLPTVDRLRQIPNAFGLRRYAVTIRTRTWAGGRPGLPVGSTPAHSDLVIDPPPRVRNVSQREVDDSGGRYQDGDLVLTSITPAYSGGGYTSAELKPTPGADQDVVYLLTGDEGTFEAQLVGDRFERPFRLELVLRRVSPPVRG